MTNGEASKILSNVKQELEKPQGYLVPKEKIHEALKRGIKALELTDDKKEIYGKGYKDGQEALAFHLELCKEEQEPCEDCISRNSLIEYLEEMIKAEKHIRLENYETRVDILERVKIKADALPPIQPKAK